MGVEGAGVHLKLGERLLQGGEVAGVWEARRGVAWHGVAGRGGGGAVDRQLAGPA